jgi:sensor histidine kinase regulating citrate/malate metabolism
LGLTLQMLSNISHYFFQSLEKKKRIKKIVLRERKRQFENKDRVTRTMLVPPLFALKIHLQVRSFILFFRKKDNIIKLQRARARM